MKRMTRDLVVAVLAAAMLSLTGCGGGGESGTAGLMSPYSCTIKAAGTSGLSPSDVALVNKVVADFAKAHGFTEAKEQGGAPGVFTPSDEKVGLALRVDSSPGGMSVGLIPSEMEGVKETAERKALVQALEKALKDKFGARAVSDLDAAAGDRG